MMGTYRIFTDATADLTPELMEGLAPIEIIPMQVEIGGAEYTYGSPDGITVQEFYRLQKAGNFATTSQINPTVYFQYFEPWLQQEVDIIYLCFSSGLSRTYQSALLAVEKLQTKYPERKTICIDTLAAAAGEGFLVREAAKRQLEGLTVDELAAWVIEYRLKVCHWFTVDTFTHLKHGGRVSTTTAVIGTALQIKPLLHVDEEGKLQAMGKPRGRKRAIEALLNCMEKGWIPALGKSVLITHSDDFKGAVSLKDRIMERFPDAEVTVTDLGPIIGAHTGPGAMTLFYWGSNR